MQSFVPFFQISEYTLFLEATLNVPLVQRVLTWHARPHLALDEHVEEVVAGLLRLGFGAQVPQVIVGNPETRQAPRADPLVVQSAALRAGDQIEELLRLR